MFIIKYHGKVFLKKYLLALMTVLLTSCTSILDLSPKYPLMGTEQDKIVNTRPENQSAEVRALDPKIRENLMLSWSPSDFKAYFDVNRSTKSEIYVNGAKHPLKQVLLKPNSPYNYYFDFLSLSPFQNCLREIRYYAQSRGSFSRDKDRTPTNAISIEPELYITSVDISQSSYAKKIHKLPSSNNTETTVLLASDGDVRLDRTLKFWSRSTNPEIPEPIYIGYRYPNETRSYNLEFYRRSTGTWEEFPTQPSSSGRYMVRFTRSCGEPVEVRGRLIRPLDPLRNHRVSLNVSPFPVAEESSSWVVHTQLYSSGE